MLAAADVANDVAAQPRLPLVSVIVTAYNYAAYIAECLASIRAQSYTNFECLVVDDASTDDTLSIVERTLAGWADPRFSVKSAPRNLGQMGAQALGLRATSGEFVVFVDADDVLLSQFLERHLFVHLNFEVPVAFTSSDQWTINGAGRVLSFHHSDLISRFFTNDGVDVVVSTDDDPPVRGVMLSWKQLHYAFGEWWWATQTSMMFRRPVLELILPSQLEPGVYRKCADAYIVKFSQLLGGSLILFEPLACYRRHGVNSFSSNPLIGARMATGDMRAHPEIEEFYRLALATWLEKADAFVAVVGQDRYDELLALFRLGVGGRGQGSGVFGRWRGSFVHRLVRRTMMRLFGSQTYAALRTAILRP